MCVLSHAVTYVQSIAAAWLFAEIPNSFCESRSQSDQNTHSRRVSLPERKSMPGTDCGVISGPIPMEESKGRNERRCNGDTGEPCREINRGMADAGLSPTGQAQADEGNGGARA
jgi:hypothetical protein